MRFGQKMVVQHLLKRFNCFIGLACRINVCMFCRASRRKNTGDNCLCCREKNVNAFGGSVPTLYGLLFSHKSRNSAKCAGTSGARQPAGIRRIESCKPARAKGTGCRALAGPLLLVITVPVGALNEWHYCSPKAGMFKHGTLSHDDVSSQCFSAGDVGSVCVCHGQFSSGEVCLQ